MGHMIDPLQHRNQYKQYMKRLLHVSVCLCRVRHGLQVQVQRRCRQDAARNERLDFTEDGSLPSPQLMRLWGEACSLCDRLASATSRWWKSSLTKDWRCYTKPTTAPTHTATPVRTPLRTPAATLSHAYTHRHSIVLNLHTAARHSSTSSARQKDSRVLPLPRCSPALELPVRRASHTLVTHLPALSVCLSAVSTLDSDTLPLCQPFSSPFPGAPGHAALDETCNARAKSVLMCSGARRQLNTS